MKVSLFFILLYILFLTKNGVYLYTRSVVAFSIAKTKPLTSFPLNAIHDRLVSVILILTR